MTKNAEFPSTFPTNTIVEAKTFSVATEYFWDGIFDETITTSIPVDDFTVMPEPLRERLKDWQAEFEDLGEKINKIEFNARGIELAQDIQDAMPEWTVRYYDVTIEEAKEMHREMEQSRGPGF